MSYNNESRTKNSNINKDKIISSAYELISKYGYNNVTISDITKASNVSKGAFYIHYDSKEDLIIDIYNKVFESAMKIDENVGEFEQIKYFLLKSIEQIYSCNVKLAQAWFSDSCKGTIYGQKKYNFDVSFIFNILNKKYPIDIAKEKAKRIVNIYYGIIVAWCFENGLNNPIDSMLVALNSEIEFIVMEGEN